MKIKFQDHTRCDFYSVLKNRVDDYFQQSQLSKNGNTWMYFKSALFLIVQIGIYLTFMTGYFSIPVFILLFMAFGIMTGLMDFNIVHDALHGAYSSNPKVNRMLGYIYDLNGTSSFIWKITHNTIHHTFTNIPGVDCDIDKAIILRLNPNDKLLRFHYYQNIYAFFLYFFVSANWILYADYQLLYNEIKKGKVKTQDILIFLGFKVINFFLTFVLPLLWLPYSAGAIILGYVCAQMAAGFTIALVFQLGHVVQNVKYVVPDDKGVVHNNWAVHEMMTTSNFATHSRVWTELLGGLNFQIEHHLFPYICHVHYPEIQKILKKTAEEFQLPYNENKTFWIALKSHYGMLKHLGRVESSPSLVKQD